MRLFFRLALCCSFLLHLQVYAESRDQALLRQGMETAGRVAGEQLVKGYLDKMFPVANSAGAGAGAASAGTQAGSSGQTVSVGSGFLFAVSLGLSVDEFSKAKTDKQKGYAVVNGAVAVLALAFPVAGLVAALVVLVVRLIDTSVSARHAQALMQIQTRINNYYKETIKMENEILNSEKQKFTFAFEKLKEAKDNVEAGEKYLKANCMNADSIDSLEKVDSCLKSTIQVIEEFQRLVDYSQSLLEPTTRILKAEAVFEAMKIDTNEFRGAIGKNRVALSEMRSGLAETLKGYGAFVSDIIIAKAQQDSSDSLPKFFKHECLSKSRRLNMQAMILLYPQHLRSESTLAVEHVSNLHQMRDLMDQFQFSGCSSVSSGDDGLDRLYDEMNRSFISTYEEVVRAGA